MDLEANIEIAKSLFKQNKYQETINACNEILIIDKNSIETLKLISRSFLAIQQIENARVYLNQILNIKPDESEVMKDLGNTYQVVGDVNTAKAYYQKALAINPSYAPAISNLGSIELSTGNKKEAISLLIKATELDQTLAPAWGNLAIAFSQLRKTVEAAAACRKFIELNPNRFDSHFLLGNILIGQKKLLEAEQSLRKTIELNPDYFQAHFNLGAVLQELGHLQEAEVSIRKSIELKPNSFESHFLLGIILIGQKKLLEAEQSLRKTIELNPDHAKAYANLGGILLNLGKSQEAELLTRKAIKIYPRYALAHYNLGGILVDLGKSQEAELSTRKAIEINPNYAIAHLNLGNILNELGRSKEAFDSYLKVIDINQKLPNIFPTISIFLKDSDPSKFDKSTLKYLLNILLLNNDIPHNDLFPAFNYLYRDELINNLEKSTSNLSEIELLINDNIIINALKKIIFKDLELEKILTKLRKSICIKIATNKENINYSELLFIITLGEQCFLNEYIYSTTEEEKISIKKIIQRCKEGEINERAISILACYFPLYKVLDQIPSLESFKSSNKNFMQLMKLQISEPLIEIDLSKKIKKLGEINNKISQKVQSQYEENPFPRWRYGNPLKERNLSFFQVINKEIKPNIINSNLENKELRILVAGCGTGSHILQTQIYDNAKITAIDLSLSSLSYAQRKINELGIDNVELIQLDILEVGLLEKKFDIIECAGVLHHMEDPSKGLQILLEVLKNNGFIRLGLYSELARQDIVKAREYISSKKLQENEESMKKFRQKIISDELKDLSSLREINDFYSFSEFRDLCFHTKEHRFTLNQLEEEITANELQFLGFILPKKIKSLYKNYFPEDEKLTNLQNWANFEKKHPNTFRSMYQFWVCKTNPN